MRFIPFVLLCMLTVPVQAQSIGTAAKNSGEFGESKPPVKVPNPFDEPKATGMSGMMMEMGGFDEEGMDAMGVGMGGYGEMEMDEGMSMGGLGQGYEMEAMMGGGPSRDKFQRGMARAIDALKKAKTGEERKVLLEYVRTALQKKYDDAIRMRREELKKIRERVTKLESELQRREAARGRVVDVQLQSVQLAAEGLLELER